jgi:hypothetical protein
MERKMTQTTEQVLKQQQQDAERDHGEQQAVTDWESEGPPPEELQDEADFASAQSRELTTPAEPSATPDDGWEQEAGTSRLLRGNLLRFSDRQWSYGRDARPMPTNVQLVALSIRVAWVRWENKKPVEAKVRMRGQPFPTRDELGDNDQAKWARRPDGSLADPWQLTKHLLMLDTKLGAVYTYVTTSGGGFGAIRDLADQVAFMRGVRPGAVPIAELNSADMETRYGRKSRPVFRVTGWHGGGEPTKLAPPSASEMLDDEQPF